jgi:2-aminoethylphosphonate-pyruvate transaminase
MIVDAISSFAGMPIDIEELGADFLVSSANKCIQGVPGFGFVIARRAALAACDRARAGSSAPARGLFLERVVYDGEELFPL